jgi:putative intracellular protease/amidase
MSADLNPTDPAAARRILLVAANPSTSTVTGWPVGFWWAELTHPYWLCTEAGYTVEIRSPRGGALVADGYSDPEDASGYSAHDLVSLGFKHSPAHAKLLQDTPSLAGVEPAAYDAVFFAGGQSPMFTFRHDPAVERLVRDFYEAGKVVALVCHATCVLLDTTLSTGERLVTGKTWTGFANSEEQFADVFVGRRIQPFWIEDEARAMPNTNFVVDQRFRAFAVRDGRLVTGQQQYSGTAAARLVVEALGR